MVEVEVIHPENDIRVTVDGATARIVRPGFMTLTRIRDRCASMTGRPW